jgi:hypothetical protein
MKQRLPIGLSLAALVVAVLGWTAVGESARNLVIPKGSVGTPQLKNGAVTTPKLRTGAVTSLKVRNGSLLAEDFKAGQLPAGQKGDKGDPGAMNVVVRTATVAVASSSTGTGVASCQAGERATGGGAMLAGGVIEQDAVVRSYPTLGTTTPATAGQVPTAWAARVLNSSLGSPARSATIFVVCASP